MQNNFYNDENTMQKFLQKRDELINGRQLCEKDIDMIVERVLQRISISPDFEKAIQEAKQLKKIIESLGGK